jgi:hypothetical protein
MADESERWLIPGFSRDSVLNYLFKQGVGRVNTAYRTAYYQEAIAQSNVYLDDLATDSLPPEPPNDFVTLTSAQIAAIFSINEAEVAEFYTAVGGGPTFSIEQSISFPHLLRVNNLLLKPNNQNIDRTFDGVTSTTKVNMIAFALRPTFGNGTYKITLKRSTGLSGELSIAGRDVVQVQNLAYVFDNDNGLLNLHEPDQARYTPNPISALKPPVLTCYVYRGSFGRLGWRIGTNAIILNEPQLLLGKTAVTNSSLIMDVSGSAFIDDLVVHSLTTSSDIRLKENIVKATACNAVLNLEPVFYNYKTRPGAKEYGLIAQEVKAVAPELVKETDGMLSVQYDRFGVHLLPIVKDQQARIERLEAQVEALLKLVSHSS